MQPQTIRVNDKGQIAGLVDIDLNHPGHPLHARGVAGIALGNIATSATWATTAALTAVNVAAEKVEALKDRAADLQRQLNWRIGLPIYTADYVPAAGTFTRRSDGVLTVREIVEARGITDWPDDETISRNRQRNIDSLDTGLSNALAGQAAAEADHATAQGLLVEAKAHDDQTGTAARRHSAAIQESMASMARDDVMRVSFHGWSPYARKLFVEWFAREGVAEVVEA